MVVVGIIKLVLRVQQVLLGEAAPYWARFHQQVEVDQVVVEVQQVEDVQLVVEVQQEVGILEEV